MKKFLIVLLIIITILGIFGWRTYNNLVEKELNVENNWAQVENQYQRRADLIPNLVSTVKGYATHEKATLEGVIEARSKATQMTISANELTPEKLASYQRTQANLSQALGKLIALREAYPDLKANRNFEDLQAQLEGTENRISTARLNFNNSTKTYNAYLRSFPTNIIGAILGFERKHFFKAEEGASKAPKVEF